MPTFLTFLATTATTVAKSHKSSSSSELPLILIVVAFAAIYFFFIRPRQQRMRQQQKTTRQIGVGDEVVTAGGIHGTVVALDSDVVEVEVAPGVVMTFLRRAVNARAKTSRPSPTSPVDDAWDVEHRRGEETPGDHPDDRP